MLESLDATAVRRWCSLSVDLLRQHEQELNDLNVYPVPDGDTGTNLLLTLQAAGHALDHAPDATTAAEALRTMARGALLGARGNSGVITAQWLNGLAQGVSGTRALQEAASAAYEAVANPVEGTILSVAKAADGVTIKEAADAAAEALDLTPTQLPVLAAAGVVDAGGRGLVLLLDAMVEALTGERSLHEVDPPTPLVLPAVSSYRGPAFEVQFLIESTQEKIAELRKALDPLGDSLVIVGGQPAWRVHVHVDDAGAAIEAALLAGRPYQLQITHLTSSKADHGPRRPDPAARAVVVTAAGNGIASLLQDEGAVTVKANPSTSEILDAILTTGAGRVAVLPTDTNLRAVAQAAADEAFGEGVKVRVIPTRSPVQALAALAVRDPSRRFEDDVIAMAEAAAACRSAEVTIASREALTVAGRCYPGDVIALVEGEVNVIGSDLTNVCTELIDRMLATGRNELVTLITGAAADPGLVPAIEAHIAQKWPLVEVHAYDGGQAHYPLLVGVE
ncbi:DAK2 domain-containing protein [Catelliglobosispora koreensis]|uniref:DAK2 domain-containing protein n=1 Tax=Catelliglobosispora koreensis TaxID=129052 RepID=UPI000477DD14|nr:DAK2 domain-containing protein [Catelliglobosispora koreensis]